LPLGLITVVDVIVRLENKVVQEWVCDASRTFLMLRR
jgi:hypothetical protein